MAMTERSRASREAILAAARRVFSERGYELATIRLVAADAAVDPALVVRYFDGKAGLFAAAVEVDLALPDLAAVPAARRGHALAEHFVCLWEDGPTAERLRILLRSASTAATARDAMSRTFEAQVRSAVSQARPDELPSSSGLRAARLASHLLGSALARYILELAPVTCLSRERFVRELAPVLQYVLDAPASEWETGIDR